MSTDQERTDRTVSRFVGPSERQLAEAEERGFERGRKRFSEEAALEVIRRDLGARQRALVLAFSVGGLFGGLSLLAWLHPWTACR